MIFTLILVTALSLIGLADCGGGGGEYYPPSVVIDNMDITKEEISTAQLDFRSKTVLEVDLNRKPENEKHIEGVKYYYFSHFDFKDEKYLLAVPLDNFVSIIDSEGRVIKKLITPRYATNAAALELIGNNGVRFLAIYIAQQATSHSSTLYILDEEFEIVYKEHLLGALWMAKEFSEMGDNLIISAEPKWIPKDEWIPVGGPWRYTLFGKGVARR